jgi:hypothetical protein
VVSGSGCRPTACLIVHQPAPSRELSASFSAAIDVNSSRLPKWHSQAALGSRACLYLSPTPAMA